MMEIRRIETMDPRTRSELRALLADAVEDGASVGFVRPLDTETAAVYWQGVAESLGPGLALFVARDEGRVVGSAQLACCSKANGRHRAEVQKLLVLRERRGRGLASALMREVEGLAASLGRTLLVLDTEEGSLASKLYEHWGWTRVGTIPDYAASPDGSLHGTTLYYKRIEAA